jgi:site-specific recombinase XerD
MTDDSEVIPLDLVQRFRTTHPVCQHHYLHRLRKTCASNWEASGVPVRTIQYMLGHKSLETTQKYLGITNLDSLTDKIDAAAGKA